MTNGIITLCHMIMSSKNNRKSKKHTLLCKLKAETTPPLIVLVSKNTCLSLIKRLMLPRSSAYYHLILSMVTCIPASKHRRPLPTHTIHLLFSFRRFPPPLKGSFFFLKSHFLLFVSRQIYHNYCIFFLVKGWKTKGIVMRCYEK